MVGQRIPGSLCRVTLTNAESVGHKAIAFETNCSDSFRFEDVGEGQWHLAADDGMGGTGSITLDVRADADSLRVGLQTAGRIRGRFSDLPTGTQLFVGTMRTVGGVRLLAFSETGADGSFCIDAVPDGRHSLFAAYAIADLWQAARAANSRGPIACVTSGCDCDIDAIATAGDCGGLQGQLLEWEGKIVNMRTVPTSQASDHWLRSPTTLNSAIDPRGFVTIAPLMPGQYELSWQNREGPRSTRIRIEPGRVADFGCLDLSR